MAQSKRVRPISYLKNNTAALVAKVVEDGDAVTITQNGEAKVVVMDVARYQQWRDTLSLLKLIAHAESDVVKGRTVSDKDAFSRAAAVVLGPEPKDA